MGGRGSTHCDVPGGGIPDDLIIKQVELPRVWVLAEGSVCGTRFSESSKQGEECTYSGRPPKFRNGSKQQKQDFLLIVHNYAVIVATYADTVQSEQPRLLPSNEGSQV